MMSALIPVTSELGARNDREKIVNTYLMTSKYVALITIGLVAFVVLEAESILRLWLGNRRGAVGCSGSDTGYRLRGKRPGWGGESDRGGCRATRV